MNMRPSSIILILGWVFFPLSSSLGAFEADHDPLVRKVIKSYNATYEIMNQMGKISRELQSASPAVAGPLQDFNRHLSYMHDLSKQGLQNFEDSAMLPGIVAKIIGAAARARSSLSRINLALAGRNISGGTRAQLQKIGQLLDGLIKDLG